MPRKLLSNSSISNAAALCAAWAAKVPKMLGGGRPRVAFCFTEAARAAFLEFAQCP